jgi:hypothetical protein
MTDRLQALLSEQCGFLRKSCDAFYAGDQTEAVRIAVAIRVFVHDTNRSEALLKQLRPDFLTLPISDKVAFLPAKGEQWQMRIEVPVGFAMSTEGIVPYAPDLKSPSYAQVTLEDWWNRSCLKIPINGGIGQYSRKDLVLVLANKEGGAHVDPKLPPDYVALIDSHPIQFWHNGMQLDSMNIARCMVAQSGVELLKSIDESFPAIRV